MHLRLLFVLLAALAPAGLLFVPWGSADAAPAPSAEVPYNLGSPPFAQLSSASCAASSCHGGGKVGAKGSEHTTWSATADASPDPHAKAYRVLFSKESQAMAKAVGGGAAHKNALCLKCHTVPCPNPAESKVEGVGCGGCHGQADGWLAAHTKPEWKTIPNRERWEKYGFAPTKNLVGRALGCASCHVGDSTREVNHDLIAAGHPRLAFEPARYHFTPNYRQHWTEKQPRAEFELRLWAVGQFASLRAATDLLRARAERAESGPWPEFSGQSCYACHHPVGDKPPLARGPRPVGVAGWEVWHTSTVAIATEFSPDLFGLTPPALEQLAKLRKAMEQTNPDPKVIAKLAAATVKELDAWLVQLQAADDAGLPPLPSDLPRKLIRRLAERAANDPDWDALAVHFLGLAAAYHAGGGAKGTPDATKPISELNALLAFPKGYNSPKDFDQARRDKVNARFADLAKPGEKR